MCVIGILYVGGIAIQGLFGCTSWLSVVLDMWFLCLFLHSTTGYKSQYGYFMLVLEKSTLHQLALLFRLGLGLEKLDVTTGDPLA